jgi:hypothetical protein
MIPQRPFFFLRHGETDWNREGRYQFDALHNHLMGPRTGPESRHAAPYLMAPGSKGWSLAPL